MKARYLAVLCLLIAGPSWGVRPRPQPPGTSPGHRAAKCLVIGHRGNPTVYAEDTLRSFDSAFAVGADMVEMDVHLTRDGVPVVFHDDTLDLTTTTHGRVDEMTLAQLKAVKAGSLRQDTPTDIIPTLEEALLLAHNKGRVLLDIKVDGMAATIAAIFERHGLPQEMAAVGTWNDAQAAEYLKHMPRAQILYTQEIPHSWAGDLIATQRKRGLKVFELRRDNIPPGFVEAAHAQGMLVYVYTVNEAAEMRRLIALGVDGIETDVPELLVHLLREH